ncbi:MAG: segregation/condensation protein A [Candidatus Micrarchaeota archaeon]
MANQVQLQLQSFTHLESMVSKPTWKDVLLELISSNSIDPWNIDLLALSDAFIRKVRDMERMDFAVQANVILAASILLRYKSNYLKSLSYQSEIPEFAAEAAEPALRPDDIPELTLSSRIPPRRQITLDELISEMEHIIRYDTEERVRIPRGSIVETLDLELPERDIERDMKALLERISGEADSEGWSLFSRVSDPSDMQRLVYTLVCLLHLVQAGSVDIRQDSMFGEIFIHPLKVTP